MITLKPGELRVFAADSLLRSPPRTPLDKSRAKQAAASPRLAIESPTPAVDGGAFPVKAIAGELVSVEADVVFDGHDKIAVSLRWQAPGETAWQEKPMRPLGNDRWQAAFPLGALGRHSYEIHAWRDRFETFRDELAKKSTAGVPVTLELMEGEALLRAASARAGKPLAAQLQSLITALPETGRGGETCHASCARPCQPDGRKRRPAVPGGVRPDPRRRRTHRGPLCELV